MDISFILTFVFRRRKKIISRIRIWLVFEACIRIRIRVIFYILPLMYTKLFLMFWLDINLSMHYKNTRFLLLFTDLHLYIYILSFHAILNSLNY